MEIQVANKTFDVKVAETDSEKEKGLQGVKELKDNEGMLFIFDEPQTVQFWMEDTLIPLDICFINEDMEIMSIYHGKPMDKTKVEEDNVLYVLEVNPGLVKEGQEMKITEEENDELPPMLVLRPDGSTQMELKGGERIYSRVFTRRLIHWAKRAKRTKKESDYKHLGKMMFDEIKAQDTREPEYVETPN